MKSITLFLLFFAAMPVPYIFAQNRAVIRTNNQGRIMRFIIDENRRILRQQVIGQVGAPQEAPRVRQPQEYEQQPPPPEPQTYAPAEPEYAAEPQAAPTYTGSYHLVGISLDFLMQNGQGFSRFSTQLDPANINTIYAGTINSWGVGNFRFGASIGLNYAYVSSKIAAFLMQFQFDTTGWTLGAVNFGVGLKIPVHPKFILSVDGYFCMAFTGAILPPLTGITIPAGNPLNIVAFLALFGFKTRVALEFPLPRNTYVAVALSYAAYPWGISSAKGTFSLNNIPLGTALVTDAFKIGIEFGWKIPTAR